MFPINFAYTIDSTSNTMPPRLSAQKQKAANEKRVRTLAAKKAPAVAAAAKPTGKKSSSQGHVLVTPPQLQRPKSANSKT